MLAAQASAVGAQRAAAPRVIGVLNSDPFANPDLWAYFFSALRDLGWTEGTNLIVVRRSANSQIDQLPNLAAELVHLNVDIIFANGTQAPLAAKKATSTIPIVIWNAGDAVELGLVSNLARPGGNITGVSLISSEISGKRLQLLKETLPGLSRVTLLLDPTNANNVSVLHESEAAARTLGLQVQTVEARGPGDIDNAFAATLRQRPDALIAAENAVTLSQRARITAFAATSRIPAMYPFRQFAEAGGLMSYGVDTKDLIDVLAKYIDKILKGAKPGDLPIEQPNKFELVINLKTAKALGLTIPQSLMVRANEVIQ
jgi:putative ABC transport system substrate-binding protein